MNIGIERGKARRTVPITIRAAVKIMEALNPFVSKNHIKSGAGKMYIIFPQFPNKATVPAVQCGHKTANREVEIGPNVFHIVP